MAARADAPKHVEWLQTEGHSGGAEGEAGGRAASWAHNEQSQAGEEETEGAPLPIISSETSPGPP